MCMRDGMEWSGRRWMVHARRGMHQMLIEGTEPPNSGREPDRRCPVLTAHCCADRMGSTVACISFLKQPTYNLVPSQIPHHAASKPTGTARRDRSALRPLASPVRR